MAKAFDIYLDGISKEFDVHLDGKTKEFDIHLNDRLTQCDIIIYSIPYRDAINIIHKLVLDSSINDFVLRRVAPLEDAGGIEIDQFVEKTTKNSFERVDNQLNTSMIVDERYKIISYHDEASIALDVDFANLFYRSFMKSEADLQVMATVSGTEIHFSLGAGGSDIVLGVDISNGDIVTKRENVQLVADLLATLQESVKKFAEPTEATTQLAANVGVVVRRYRLLSEPDEFDLLSLDDMTLEDLDYVVVDIEPSTGNELGKAKLGFMRLGSTRSCIL